MGTIASTALSGLTIGDPTILPGGAPGFDQARTVKRIRLRIDAEVILTAAALAQASWWAGVYVAGVGEPLRDPTTNVTTDSATDWMDWWQMRTVSGNGQAAGTVLFPMYDALDWNRDIRVARRVNYD